jgi:hypothetical protein
MTKLLVYLKSLRVELPHALSLTAAILGMVSTALAQNGSPLLAPYHSLFVGGAYVAAFLTAPNLTSGASLLNVKAWWQSLEAKMPHGLTATAALLVAAITAVNDVSSPLLTTRVHHALGLIAMALTLAASANVSNLPSAGATPPAPPSPPATP